MLGIAFAIAAIPAHFQDPGRGRSLEHVEALVPDSETAIAIGRAILRPLFGKRAEELREPYKADLKGDIWRVVGNPPLRPDTTFNPVYVYIAKYNGMVIEVSRADVPSRKSLEQYRATLRFWRARNARESGKPEKHRTRRT